MSLHALAQDMATKGRNGDSMLVHMAPSEVHGLHALALAHGENVTINPLTGLPEMFSLKKILKAALPAIAGFALGPAGFGLMSSAMAGLTVGGVTALSSGSLSKGLMAGLGAYGGASLGESFANAGTGSIARDAIAAQQAAGTFPTLAEGATQAQVAEYASQVGAARDAAVANAGNAGFGAKMSAGLGAITNNPELYGRDLLKAGMMAAGPILADQAVETKTKMPEFASSPSYYRPYEFDPETKGLRSLGSVEAKGLAAGGAVAFADGGSTYDDLLSRAESLRVNNTALAPQVGPHIAPDGRVSMFMGNGWYSGFASGQELEDLKAKQLANFAQMQQPQQQPTTGLGALPTNTPSPAPGGIGDLVYRPLSQVNQKAAQQGIGNDPLNDRQQGLEKVMIDRGLMDEMNTYGVNAGGYGKAYNPVGISESVKTDNALQNAYYDAIRNDLSEAERQRSAGNLLDILKQYEDRTRTSTTPPQITSTEAIRPTTEITPSTYTVRGEQIAPQTSTAPPQITATAANRPVANITPSMLTTQAAAPVPLTSTAPPAITATAAPTMPSIPVGGGGSAGVAALRPFDYQNTPITRLPESRPIAAEDAMTGESLAAYQRLIGRGARSQAPAPQASAPAINPSAFAGYRSTSGNTPSAAAPSTVATTASNATVGADGTIYEPSGDGAQTYTYQISANVAPKDSKGRPISPGPGKEWYFDGQYQRVRDIQNHNDAGGYAMGGAVPGYALGGQAEYHLGGYSDGGRLLRGPGDGVSDSIPATIGDKQPARLADGEFVVPARIVSELGNGSTDAGARQLYAMMDRVQRARGNTTGENRVAANTRTEQYLPA